MEPSDGAAVASLTRDDLSPPPGVERSRLRRSLLTLAVAVVVAVAVITLVPGLGSLRARFAHASPAWIALGAVLKIASGLSYVAAFRGVFCRGMSWRVSTQIGLAELGANAVVPTGGAGGLLVPALVAATAIVVTIAGGRWAAAAEGRRTARSGPTSRTAEALRALSGGVAEALSLLRALDPWLLCGLVGYLAFDVMILWATFHAFGSVPPLAIIWIGYLIGELGGLVPLPGGVGGVDLGLVGTLALYHVSFAAATAAVLAYRALALTVPAALGAVAFVLLRRSLAREALAISSCAPGGEVEVIGRGSVRITA